MELEATILERLQELRRWQVEQQERLMKQQQEQREMLSYEQDRMYQALGLSVQGIAVEDETVGDRVLDSSRRNESEIQNEESKIVESSVRESPREVEETEEQFVVRDRMDNSTREDDRKMGLHVPALNLKTNRHLDYRSSMDCFSPRSETISDNEASVMTISSERTPDKNRGRVSDLSMEGVEPLPVENPALRRVAIDDLPVPSPKKDFTTLLEERLRDCEEIAERSGGEVGRAVVKRPFLKKGEGLARFRPNPGGQPANRRTRPRSSSLSANIRLPSAPASKGTAARTTKETPRSSRASAASTRSVAVPAVAQNKLSLKNVPPPKKKVRSKSMSAVTIGRQSGNSLSKTKAHADINSSSDFESKQRRELEEMRIFELLEEKAEHSSFCSNSSTVLALFRQSTPLKTKNSQKNSKDSKQRLINNDSMKHESSDTSLEEIIRTTKSNRPAPGSPVTKIRETVIQKDIVFSKWDSGPFEDENVNGISSPNNCKRGLQRAIAAGSYKSTKHTTIQFNNNNNINNNNNNINNGRKLVVHSDEEEDLCNISSSTNVDLAYDTNYRKVERKGSNPGNDELPDDKEGPNVSLHVRFSEYNEYKTIGLTDTSMMSNDGNPPRNINTEGNNKAWSEHSTSSESSDVEVLFPKSKPIVCSRITSVDKESLGPKQEKDEIRAYGDESTDQTTDDEQYTSTCSTDTSYDGENTLSEAKPEKRTSQTQESDDESSEACDDSGSTIKQENDESTTGNLKGIDSVDVNGTIFKSELLKTRLLELEREIEIFRKENAALANQRKKLQEEQRQLHKEFRQKEENLEKERKNAEENMQEEKKRLAREKSALESRLRDAREKSLQSKQERQEIQALREQLDEMREDASQKESRWSAAQARQKSQIRVLQTENARLKQELEKLRSSRGNNSRIRRPPASSNTRAIHQINKQLDAKKKVSPKRDSSSDEENCRPSKVVYKEYEVEEIPADPETRSDVVAEMNDDGSRIIVYNGASQHPGKMEEDVRKKRNLYTDLLNEATQGLRGREEISIGKPTAFEKSNQSPGGNNNEKEERFETGSSDSASQRKTESSFKRSYESAIETYKRSEEVVGRNSGELSKSSAARTNHAAQQDSKRSPDRLGSLRNEGILDNSAAAGKQDIREVLCPDGHIEYWYPNGNVKKVFPDRNVTKMIYYNGDVRENAEDGSVKYFYASTRTWHTTLPDGLEILEFPDGQVERRAKNGTIEVSFPDGSVRLLQADGTEKWVLPDGTVAETFPDGDKILSFPNGQREVHTKEHKRREYPDGTIKLVYPDGTQETRYSTGRVRVKDKDGNLIMDVHHR